MDKQNPQDSIPPLVIRINPDGIGVKVEGPLLNKELCWRMLTDAASAILSYKGPEENRILVPTLLPPRDVGKTQ